MILNDTDGKGLLLSNHAQCQIQASRSRRYNFYHHGIWCSFQKRQIHSFGGNMHGAERNYMKKNWMEKNKYQIGALKYGIWERKQRAKWSQAETLNLKSECVKEVMRGNGGVRINKGSSKMDDNGTLCVLLQCQHLKRGCCTSNIQTIRYTNVNWKISKKLFLLLCLLAWDIIPFHLPSVAHSSLLLKYVFDTYYIPDPELARRRHMQ